MKAKAKKPGDGFMTLAEVCRAFDCSPQNFGKTLRPLLSDKDIRNPGGKGVAFRCRALIDAWTARKVEQALEGAASDPLLAGPASPALERYRAARAEREELALERDRGGWMETAAVHDHLQKFCALIRRGGEIIQRQFGNPGAVAFNEAICAALDLLYREFPAPPPTGAASGPTPTSEEQP